MKSAGAHRFAECLDAVAGFCWCAEPSRLQPLQQARQEALQLVLLGQQCCQLLTCLRSGGLKLSHALLKTSCKTEARELLALVPSLPNQLQSPGVKGLSFLCALLAA